MHWELILIEMPWPQMAWPLCQKLKDASWSYFNALKYTFQKGLKSTQLYLKLCLSMKNILFCILRWEKVLCFLFFVYLSIFNKTVNQNERSFFFLSASRQVAWSRKIFRIFKGEWERQEWVFNHSDFDCHVLNSCPNWKSLSSISQLDCQGRQASGLWNYLVTQFHNFGMESETTE